MIQFNQTKLQTAADIIMNGAIEFLAAKHGITIEQVVSEIQSGKVKAVEQFTTLILVGTKEVKKLADEGLINFNK